jgi:hypothetical protein
LRPATGRRHLTPVRAEVTPCLQILPGSPVVGKGQCQAPKPYPDFPLTPHNSGAWMKKINGRIHYFGRWGRIVDGVMVRVEGDGRKEALELSKAQADDLHAGRTPRAKTEGLTVGDLCNRFLTAKLRQRDAGEIGARMIERVPSDGRRGASDRLRARGAG